MHPLNGNKFWKLRDKDGRKRLFSNKEELIEAATGYFNYCDETPLKKPELIKYRGEGKETTLSLTRMYSLDGLCNYLGVSASYFRTAKRELSEKVEKDKATDTEAELLDAIEMIEQTIREQQIAGAAVGVFAPNLVSRLNGIADNQNITTTQPVMNVTVRDEQTADNLNELE